MCFYQTLFQNKYLKRFLFATCFSKRQTVARVSLGELRKGARSDDLELGHAEARLVHSQWPRGARSSRLSPSPGFAAVWVPLSASWQRPGDSETIPCS